MLSLADFNGAVSRLVSVLVGTVTVTGRETPVVDGQRGVGNFNWPKVMPSNWPPAGLFHGHAQVARMSQCRSCAMSRRGKYLDVPLRSIQPDPLPILDQMRSVLYAHDARQAVLSCDHGA